MYADAALMPWLAVLTDALAGWRPFDAHTHTGAGDPDGYRLSAAELVAALEPLGARAVVFPLAQAEGYRAANDRVLAEAGASGGRLVAFCRVDPRRDPVGEARRCLDAGARGIKLHPRAERFDLGEAGVRAVFATADERRVPVVVHAGRGIPRLGRDALALCAEYPQARLVLAHAAIADLSWLWRHVGEYPNLFFDTAWWNPGDMLALLRLVPPGRVLLGSDTPYNTLVAAAHLVVRCGVYVGLDREQLACVCGGQLERLLEGRAPLDVGPVPTRVEQPLDPLLERVYTLLLAALGRMLEGRAGEEYLELAALACRVGPGGPHGRRLSSVAELLERRRGYAERAAGPDGARRAGFQLVIAAAAVARTPGTALPGGTAVR